MTESLINDNVEDKSTTAVVSSTTSSSSSNSNAIVFGSKYKHNLRSTISYEKVPSKYNDIIDLILSPDLEIVSSLCSTTLVRETVPNTVHISEYLILFFEYHCNLKSSYILKWAIDREIDNTSNSATLFRGLSTATRLISAFYKRVGESYLKYLLQPFVVDLCSRNFSFEIDPEKAGKGVNIQTNLEKLITITQQLLDKILDSVDQCPLPIRQILNHTQEKVEKRFKSMKTTVVGGFIFLRFICPAIVAPEAFGLIPKDEEPTSETRRSLVLVSKLLQNLANEMPFGSGIKEEYMTFLNDFISSNSSRIHIFFDSLAAQDSTVNNSGSSISSSNNTSSNNLVGGGNANGNGSSSSSTTTTPSLGSIQKTNATSANASGSVFDTLQLDGGNNNTVNNNNNNNTPTNTTPSKPSEDLNNLNVLINQIIENREKIENYILDENNYPSNVSNEIIKRLDSSLHSVKQKNIFKSLGLPWMRGKEGNNKESNNGNNGNNSSSAGGKLKKSPSSNNVVSNSSHIQQLQQQVEKEKQSSDKKQTIQLSQSQQLLENTITNGNRSLSKNHQFSQSYAQIDELSEMKDQKEIDNINLMAENSKLRKELEDAKMRNNLMKRLRDELDREKTEKKELKALVKRCNDRLKSLDPELDLINDLSPWCDDGPSVGSNTDLQSIIEETLGVGGGSGSGMNGGKKKSNSALGISKIKQSSDQLNTPSSAHSLSSSTTNVPLIVNTPPIANVTNNTNITSTTTTPSILNDINSTSSLQPSPQPQSINHSTNYIPHLDVSCDSNNSTASSAGNVIGNATAINTNNNVINNNLNIIKKSSTNASISDITSEADEHTSKTGSNISIGSQNNSQQLASSNSNNNNSNNGGGSSVVGGASIKSSSNSTVNNSRRNSTTSEISNINDTTVDPSNYEKQNQLIQTVVEGGEIQDDSACDLLEFLKEVANRKQELQATKEKQKQEEKEQKQKASIFFKFSKLGSSKKKEKKSSNSPVLTSTPSSKNLKIDENKDNNPSSASVMNI